MLYLQDKMPEKTRKKVLFVITKSNFGGAQRHVYDLAAMLPRNQFEAVVACGGEGILKEKLDNTGVRTITIKNLQRDTYVLKDSFSFLTIFRIIRSEKPDILHLHSTKAGGLGALAGRMLGIKKIIFTAHGWAFKEKRAWWQRKVIYLASWLTIILCHKTIVVSEEDFKKSPSFLIGKKIVKINNGISQIDFLPKEEARQKLGMKLSEKTLIIGIIAELHKNKGVEFAIRALADLKRNKDMVALAVLGEGEERLGLEKMIKDNGLEQSVFLLGYKEKAAQFLKAFDIFLLPSLKEGMPYVLLEAGFAGLPVIAARIGGIPEVISEMKSGILVRPGDPKEIAFAVRFLIRNKSKAEEFGKRLKEKILNEFSVEKTVEKIVEVYNE